MKTGIKKVGLKRGLSAVMALLMGSSVSVFAENIGVCTHMAHPHAGNTIPGVLDAVERLESTYIRDELRWGWGMQASQTAELKMPDANWINDAEKREINSLVILAFGNSVFSQSKSDIEIPTLDNKEYFDKFIEYVRFVVQNCKGKAEAFEIWNEPNHGPFNYQIANGLDYTPADYVELVKATSEAIKAQYQEGETLPKIVGGAHLFGGTKDETWIEDLFKAGIGNYIDAFSIHVYTHEKSPENEMEEYYDKIEKVMDAYGFDGEIWLTETGYSTATDGDNATEEQQAAWSVRTKILWDNYLKTNGRKGEFFWYNLRNGGTDSKARENNFGLIDYNYNEKPAFKSIKLYNELLKDRTFESLSSNGSYYTFKNQAKYKDEVTGDYTYILYKGKYASALATVPLSGNVAYLYDYQGNIVNTYTDTNQSISVTYTENPQFVHCVSYKTSIDDLKYDANKNVCTISGKTNIPNDELTISLSDNGEIVQSETVKVVDGEYKIQFSVDYDGEYTVSAGKAEVEALNSTFYAEREFFFERVNAVPENIEYGLSASYNSGNMTVTLSGKLMNESGNDTSGILNAVVVKDGADMDSVALSDIVYMDDVYAENGEFEINFSVKNANSEKYKLYLRTENSGKEDDSFGNTENGKYVYTFDFSVNENDIQLKASVNTRETEDAVMIIAQYDVSGKLMKVETKTLSTNAGEDCLSIAKNSDATSYKAYVWDSLTGMKPIVPITEIK